MTKFIGYDKLPLIMTKEFSPVIAISRITNKLKQITSPHGLRHFGQKLTNEKGRTQGETITTLAKLNRQQEPVLAMQEVERRTIYNLKKLLTPAKVIQTRDRVTIFNKESGEHAVRMHFEAELLGGIRSSEIKMDSNGRIVYANNLGFKETETGQQIFQVAENRLVSLPPLPEITERIIAQEPFFDDVSASEIVASVEVKIR